MVLLDWGPIAKETLKIERVSIKYTKEGLGFRVYPKKLEAR